MQTSLKFEPVGADQWAAADKKYAFTITRESNVFVSLDPFFVARAGRLDGSKRCQIGRNFKTFDAAVRLCSNFTRVFRRQIAYHEAGPAVAAQLLGFNNVRIDMEADEYRAIVWYKGPTLTVLAKGDRARRDLYALLMFSVAGLVAEVKIAGYPADYVEKDADGFVSIPWLAVRVARIEAGLPICGHKKCEIPFDAERIADVIKRAEDEAFALLKANWLIVKRVTNALCRQDRLTAIELEDLIAGKRRRPKKVAAAVIERNIARGRRHRIDLHA
jgi:hypothetical protein